MKIRKKQLWKIPALVLVGGILAFYLTVYLGRFIFVVQAPGAGGATDVTINQTRYLLFAGVLLAAAFVDGALIARQMTRKETAVSALIVVVFSQVLLFAEPALQEVSLDLTVVLAQTMCLRDGLSTVLMDLTDSLYLSAFLANLWPLLLIPFGRKELPEE